MSSSSSTAELLLFDVGFRPKAAQFVPLSEADYLHEAFLDQRLLQSGQRRGQVVPVEKLPAGMTDAAADPGFIFHIGHVGSTLLSRLLGEASDVLPIREPQVLRTLALSFLDRSKPHSLISEADHRDLCALSVKMLGRPMGARRLPIIKATSFASVMARDVAALTSAPMLGMMTGARTYMATIFGGENSRRETLNLGPFRRQMIARHLPDETFALHELSEGEWIAMSWLAGMLDLGALQDSGGERVMLLDFSRFLEDPDRALAETAAHFQCDLPDEARRAALAGPIMSRYSKAQEHAYSPGLRSQIIGEALNTHAAEISRGLAWLDRMAGLHDPVRRALETAGS